MTNKQIVNFIKDAVTLKIRVDDNLNDNEQCDINRFVGYLGEFVDTVEYMDVRSFYALLDDIETRRQAND